MEDPGAALTARGVTNRMRVDVDEPTEKACIKCGETKPLDAFYVRRGKHQARCKACVLAGNKAYIDEHREVARAAARRWRERNPDKVRAKNVAWHAANKDYNRERVLAWRKANPEAWKAVQAKWRDREDRREEARARTAEWREQNADRLAAWLAANQDKLRANEGRRRARKVAAAVGKIDTEALWVKADGKCYLCGEDLDRALKYPDPLSRSLDHIVPLSKGGAHSQDNTAYTHLACNVSKSARLL